MNKYIKKGLERCNVAYAGPSLLEFTYS